MLEWFQEQMQWNCIQTFTGHQGAFAGVNSVAFSPDEKIRFFR
ncbi:MAG: hypothetical protein ACYTXA_20150 [Nostoc sp.]